MALERRALRVGERARLAEDLLGHAELAEVVQAACEARQLDGLFVRAQPPGEARRELGDALGVAAALGVAGVDRLGEPLGRPVAGRVTVRRAASGRLAADLASPVARLALALLLGPVQRVVGVA